MVFFEVYYEAPSMDEGNDVLAHTTVYYAWRGLPNAKDSKQNLK